MQKFFYSIRSKFQDGFFLKIFLLIWLPILLIMVFSVISIYSYNKNFVAMLKSSYRAKLETICQENETSLQNISTILKILSNNDSFKSAATSPVNPDTESVRNIPDILTQIKDSNVLIDSIAIYNRDTTTVYANSGIINAVSYFTYEYKYAEYSKNYWDFFKNPIGDRKILSPSLVSTGDEQKIIIPIIFTKINDIQFVHPVIVNINLSKVINNANAAKLTDKSIFLIVNKQNRNIFNENNDFQAELGSNFFDGIFAYSFSAFDCSVDQEKTLVMSYSPSSSALGYTYVALVPYADLHKSVSRILYVLIIAGLFVLIAVSSIIYFITKRIYTPIESLSSLFKNSTDKKESSSNPDAIRRLHNAIQETLHSNAYLTNTLSKNLPLIQERYLINLLNSNEHYMLPEDYTDSPISFQYDYFCSVVIKLRPTEQFYTIYNNLEYNSIKYGIHNIIQSEFSEEFETYIISSEADTVYVLLNLPDDTQSEQISEILSRFQEVMLFDKDYINIKIGVGGIYPNLEGMKKSHHEAKIFVSTFSGMTHVKLDSDKKLKPTSYIFSTNDENILLNQLISGQTDAAKNIIEEILNKNSSHKISNTGIIQLYIHILQVIFKVMRIRGIEYDTENCGDFNIISEIIKQPALEIHEAVLSYITIIDNHIGNSTVKISIHSVISYIEANYKSEIGLETIADQFSTTPKYLSKLIKDKLGIKFVDYLAELRINEAKRLLSETDKNINDIFTEAGFNNRNTFIRTFKKCTGLTPSEFRKVNNKFLKT